MRLWRVLLILPFIVFAIGLAGYYYLNQQLHSVGIIDWDIEFDQLTIDHVIIKRLELTLDSLPQFSPQTTSAELNLTKLLSIKLPELLPERIDIKSLRVKGSFLSSNISATLKLLNRERLSLQITSYQPVAATLKLTRNDGRIKLKINSTNAELQARYDFRSGQLNANGRYLLAAQQLADNVSLEQVPVHVQWQGTLPPQVPSASLEGFASALSGELLLSVKQPTKIKISGTETMATGQLKLDVNNGFIKSHRLELQGDTDHLTSFTELSLSEPLKPLAWNLNNSGPLSLPLLAVQTVVINPPWPLGLNGELILEGHIRIQHQSEIKAKQLKSRVEINEFSWQQVPQLSALLAHFAPQVVIDKADISGQADLSVFWNNNRWQVTDGRLKIQQSDWHVDTLSATGSTLNFRFHGNNRLLSINNADLSIERIQQGFVFGPITAEFGLQLPFQNPRQSTLHLKQHSIKALGGRIRIPNKDYTLANTFLLPIVFKGISLEKLMQQYPSDKISIDGEVSGTIPLYWNSKQLTVKQGYMNALAPGGHLQVDSSALKSLAGSNPSLKTLTGVLGNFYYQQLSASIDYDKDGELLLTLQLKGSNPELENGRPVELNIQLEEDLPALIKGLQLSNSLNDAIRKQVEQKIN